MGVGLSVDVVVGIGVELGVDVGRETTMSSLAQCNRMILS